MTPPRPDRDRSRWYRAPGCGRSHARLSSLFVTCLLLSAARAQLAAAQSTAAPGNAIPARFALRFDPTSRCPELRSADPGDADVAVAVVVFMVGPTGVPSQPTIRASSGSQALDAAAVSCVLKLKFRPATSLGEGTAVSSWQQAAWRWAKTPPERPAEPAATAATPAPPSPPAAAAAAVTAAAVGGAAVATVSATAKTNDAVSAPHGSYSSVGAVEVRVCVDKKGRLVQDPTVVHSSGDLEFDAAALQLVRSGSGHYPRATGADGKPVSGCEQLAIRLE